MDTSTSKLSSSNLSLVRSTVLLSSEPPLEPPQHVVTIKSKTSKYIQESIQGPANASLKKFKHFLIKTYPLLPSKFLFERCWGPKADRLIPEDRERFTTFEHLGGICRLKPWIPEDWKEDEVAENSRPQTSPHSSGMGSDAFGFGFSLGNEAEDSCQCFTNGEKSPESQSASNRLMLGSSSFASSDIRESKRIGSSMGILKPRKDESSSMLTMSAEKLGILKNSPTGLYQPTLISTRLNPNNPEPIWNDPPAKAAARAEWKPPAKPIFKRVTGRAHLALPDLCPRRPCHEKKKEKVIKKIMKGADEQKRLIEEAERNKLLAEAQQLEMMELNERRAKLREMERLRYQKEMQKKQLQASK